MKPIAVLGHVAIDTIITKSGSRQELGGPPTYISLIFHELGVETVAVTKVGYDFPDIYASTLAERGVKVPKRSEEPTTRFILDYTSGERTIRVPTVCEPIMPMEVESLPETAIIAPIIQEIPDSTIKKISSSIIAIDPQGFVRHRKPDGEISFQPWINRELLARTSVLKASERELGLITGVSGWDGLMKLNEGGVRVSLVTKGPGGADMISDGVRFSIPTYSSLEIVDTTGAGDSFIAGFVSEYARGEPPIWCACYGSAAASAVIETIGPRITANRNEITRRAENIYDRLIRLS